MKLAMASGVERCRGKHLDGHDAPHQAVLGLEHLAHAALADRVDDLVGAEIEFRAADLQLLGLPAIEAAQLDQLGGQLRRRRFRSRCRPGRPASRSASLGLENLLDA